MWPSEEWASRLYDLANWFLIAALIVGAASTGLLVWMGNVKEEYLKRDLAATSERAAHAEQRASEATQKAEEEHLARVRIEEKLAGWKLDAGAQARIIKKLEQYKKTPFRFGGKPKRDGFYGSDRWDFGVRWMDSAST
jgi:hypothetical protein